MAGFYDEMKNRAGRIPGVQRVADAASDFAAERQVKRLDKAQNQGKKGVFQKGESRYNINQRRAQAEAEKARRRAEGGRVKPETASKLKAHATRLETELGKGNIPKKTPKTPSTGPNAAQRTARRVATGTPKVAAKAAPLGIVAGLHNRRARETDARLQAALADPKNKGADPITLRDSIRDQVYTEMAPQNSGVLGDYVENVKDDYRYNREQGSNPVSAGLKTGLENVAQAGHGLISDFGELGTAVEAGFGFTKDAITGANKQKPWESYVAEAGREGIDASLRQTGEEMAANVESPASRQALRNGGGVDLDVGDAQGVATSLSGNPSNVLENPTVDLLQGDGDPNATAASLSGRPSNLDTAATAPTTLRDGVTEQNYGGTRVFGYKPQTAEEAKEFGNLGIYSDSRSGATPQGFRADLQNKGAAAYNPKEEAAVVAERRNKLSDVLAQGQRQVNEAERNRQINLLQRRQRRLLSKAQKSNNPREQAALAAAANAAGNTLGQLRETDEARIKAAGEASKTTGLDKERLKRTYDLDDRQYEQYQADFDNLFSGDPAKTNGVIGRAMSSLAPGNQSARASADTMVRSVLHELLSDDQFFGLGDDAPNPDSPDFYKGLVFDPVAGTLGFGAEFESRDKSGLLDTAGAETDLTEIFEERYGIRRDLSKRLLNTLIGTTGSL